MTDLACLESVRAHDDATDAVAADCGVVYSASADGRVKAWERGKGEAARRSTRRGRLGHRGGGGGVRDPASCVRSGTARLGWAWPGPVGCWAGPVGEKDFF